MVFAMGFDFEKLAQLAKSDPKAFEAERLRLLREVVDAAPPHLKPRAERTLMRIQATRAVARTSLESALLASRAMLASFEELRSAMNEMVAAMAIEKARLSSATAVAFPKKNPQ